MSKARLEAFSDGVIAIILTIMVLELRVPNKYSFEALMALWPVFAAYLLSYLNIYLVWVNHQEIFTPMKSIDRRVLRANGRLLFAASFVPFATSFAAEGLWQSPVAVAVYGLVMVGVSLAFTRLRVAASRCTDDPDLKSRQLAEGRVSLYIAGSFLVGALCAYFVPRLGLILYAATPMAAIVHARRRFAAMEN